MYHRSSEQSYRSQLSVERVTSKSSKMLVISISATRHGSPKTVRLRGIRLVLNGFLEIMEETLSGLESEAEFLVELTFTSKTVSISTWSREESDGLRGYGRVRTTSCRGFVTPYSPTLLFHEFRHRLRLLVRLQFDIREAVQLSPFFLPRSNKKKNSTSELDRTFLLPPPSHQSVESHRTLPRSHRFYSRTGFKRNKSTKCARNFHSHE